MIKLLNRVTYIVTVITLLCALASPTKAFATETLTIAVSTNALGAFTEIKDAYEVESGAKVTIVSGSSGKLYAQIIQGAPFDIFFSADAERPLLIEKAGLAKPGSRFIYGEGTLVLWQRDSKSELDGLDTLTCSDTLRIAIANPETAPYGAAAIEVLKNAEIFKDVEAKLVYGENVGQALSFTATGNADIAVVSLSAIKGLDYGIYLLIDKTLYSPITQGAVTMKNAPHEAGDFVEFLKNSEKANSILTDYGYSIPPRN
jgi:molybdate transport system substrate-binding protein